MLIQNWANTFGWPAFTRELNSFKPQVLFCYRYRLCACYRCLLYYFCIISYLQTIKQKISPYDIDNQLVTHLLLCGTWFGEKPFHCLASIKRIVTGTESWPVGSCNSYGLWISDCQRRRRRRRRQICRCSAVSSWQLATGNRQLEWE